VVHVHDITLLDHIMEVYIVAVNPFRPIRPKLPVRRDIYHVIRSIANLLRTHDTQTKVAFLQVHHDAKSLSCFN
ncbi:MAG: hypothetical protein V2I33_21065, partial [Kangiellaceae bacterium]|nr:hypothetical protein [Kangiellaceae bacterium]